MRTRADEMRYAMVAPLRQRMGLMPLTKPLRDELPQIPAKVSRGGPIAHVKADFWGGSGTQTASLWRDGAQLWGPEHTSTFTGPRDDWPINAALARLGMVSTRGPGAPEYEDYHDLFLEVGLGQGRDEEDWRWAASRAGWATSYDAWEERLRAEREEAAREAAERATYEKLPDVPVVLNGKEIMALLGIPQSRMIGAALRHQQELHLARGPLSREDAEAALREWAAGEGLTGGRDGRN